MYLIYIISIRVIEKQKLNQNWNCNVGMSSLSANGSRIILQFLGSFNFILSKVLGFQKTRYKIYQL